jgi:hypothetical protein
MAVVETVGTMLNRPIINYCSQWNNFSEVSHVFPRVFVHRLLRQQTDIIFVTYTGKFTMITQTSRIF